MKINSISKNYFVNNNFSHKDNTKNPEQKECEGSSNNILSNYNIAFQGLFNRRNNNDNLFDARLLNYDLYMRPDMEFEVTSDTRFELGENGYIIDLGTKKFKPLIEGLKKKQSIIIGREPEMPESIIKASRLDNANCVQTLCSLTPIDDTVSRKHIQITRNNKGILIAKDLNSTNGTKILHNIEYPDYYAGQFKLVSGVKYYLPFKSVIGIADDSILLQDYSQDFARLKDGESLIVGTDKKADIKRYRNVSAQHLKLTKNGDGLLVEDLHSDNGSTFLGVMKNYEADYSDLTYIYPLKSGKKTKVPNDCQLYIGNDLTIDLRNRNILNELDKKHKITVGRLNTCDFIVPEFHDQVSRLHLLIEKDDNDIIVTDLSSTNGTNVVPKRKIRPFYSDLSMLSLKQGNIGDCYLLSTIYAMSQNPVGLRYLENMVRVDDDGNYVVKFNNKPEIIIAPDELDGQIDNKGNKKYSVSGDLGIKAIERAYGRMIKDESWWENSKGTVVVLDRGGFSNESLYKMTGLYSKTCNIKNDNIYRILYDIEQSGGNKNHILTCSTPNRGKYNGYVDPDHEFIENHAYAIKYINSKTQTIGIINPHNTKKTHSISWEDFSKYFDYLHDANTQFIV